MIFVCKIVSKETGFYNVLLNNTDILQIPSGDVTIRKVYYPGTLDKDQLYYIQGELVEETTGKKLVVNKAFLLQEVASGIPRDSVTDPLPLTDKDRFIITNSDSFSIDLFSS